MVTSRRVLIGPMVAALLLMGVSATQAAPQAVRGATVKAVIVDSFVNCDATETIWDDLSANWSQFGSVPITIDISLCADAFTYDDLVASGADVVIISDPAGDNVQYSSSEVKAVSRYAKEGHNVIGTYFVFALGQIDNRALAPIFGLRAAIPYKPTAQNVNPTYRIRTPDSPLFRNIGATYASSGLPRTVVPADGAWGGNELNGAMIVGRTPSSVAAIFQYDAAQYTAIYISNMPEFLGGTTDEQFLYNAIIYPQTGS